MRLWDPREMELPDIGLVLMQDAETGEQLFVDTHDRRFRQRFREAALRRQATWTRPSDRRRWTCYRFRPKTTWCGRSWGSAARRKQQRHSRGHGLIGEVAMEFRWPFMLWSLLAIPC